VVSGLGGASRPARFRIPSDRLFHLGTMAAGLSVIFFIFWIGYQLFTVSEPTRHKFGWSILTGTTWDVNKEIYGALPFIYGSFASALVSLIIAVPLAVGSAIFLTQYAPPWLSKPIAFLLDLLAAVPSIIFGLWGFLVMCPFLQLHVNPWLTDHFGTLPVFAGPADMNNILAAGLILALMILSFIAAVSREVLLAVPPGLREASMGLGATKWETIRSAILPAGTSGIMGASVLGLGRAVGETMAAVMVIGNNAHIQASIMKAGYSMPALLANEFNEAFNEPMHRSALLEIGLILFALTFFLNALARLLIRLTSKTAKKPVEGGFLSQTYKYFGFGGRIFVYICLVLIVLLQAISDVRAKGAVGLLSPIEIIAVGYLLIRVASVRLAGTAKWFAFRKSNDWLMASLAAITSTVACVGLFLVLGYVIKNGWHGLNLDLFTQLPKPAGTPGGGLKNAIVGTIVLVAIAGCIGVPLGVFGGIFLSEYPESKLSFPIRFASDVLSGIPSVVIGLFAYAAFVLPFKHFSALAGGAALGLMMIPTVIRVTDEMMRLVPMGLREASVGLGASRMQTTLRVILPAARKGVITGILLAIARVAGETAPLLFTAFGNNNIPTSLKEPISSLTLKIYEYAGSPADDWVQQAWSGALVLVLLISVLSLSARLATRNKYA